MHDNDFFGHPEHYGFHWWPGMFFSGFMLLFWIAGLIALAWLLLPKILPSVKAKFTEVFHRPPVASSPLEVLRYRYVTGEIDTATFQRMEEQLMASYQPQEHYPRD